MVVESSCVREPRVTFALIDPPSGPTVTGGAEYVISRPICGRANINACTCFMPRILMAALGRGRYQDLETQNGLHAVQKAIKGWRWPRYIGSYAVEALRV